MAIQTTTVVEENNRERRYSGDDKGNTEFLCDPSVIAEFKFACYAVNATVGAGQRRDSGAFLPA